MKNLIILFCLLFIICFSPSRLFSQHLQDSIWVKINMTNGDLHIGQILEVTEYSIRLITKPNGQFYIKRADIKKMKFLRLRQVIGYVSSLVTPYANSYFLGPSAYGLKGGEGYYQNSLFLYNGINVGITKNVEIGGALLLIPLIDFDGGSSTSVASILSAKFSLPVKKDYFNLAVGGVYMNFSEEEAKGGGGIYGLATFGQQNNNISAGFGLTYGFNEGFSSAPTVMLSYTKRGNGHWAFVSENYMIRKENSSLLALSSGTRYIGPRMRIDFGMFLLSEVDKSGFNGLIPLPWFSFSVTIGRKRNKPIIDKYIF